jgi:amino acid adenylation domain-containing protein
LPSLESTRAAQKIAAMEPVGAKLSAAHHCIHRLFEAQVERTPDSVSVLHGGQTLSYVELNGRANQLARFLVRLGVGLGTRVGIALQSSPNLPVALLGVLKAGAACLPLDPNYPKDRLQLMLEDAQPAAVLTEDHLAGGFSSSAAKLVRMDAEDHHIFHGANNNLETNDDPSGLAYVIYTSGSTGKPRGVLLPHCGLANHHLAAIALYQLESLDRVLQFSSISFDIAIEEIFPALLCGATVVLKTDSFSLQADEFLQWVQQQQVTVLDLPTAFWHELVHQMEASSGLALPDSLRMVILGGEKASTKTYRVWQKFARDRVRLINTYGPTETSVIVTAFEPARSLNPNLGDTLPLGLSVANAEIHLLDQNLMPVPPDAVGELYIGGPPVGGGYLNQPELTAQKFLADPFSQNPAARLYKTGDLARYAADGNLEFLGRVDFQVKIRGFRVEPGEIEAVLHQYSGIAQSVVLSHEMENGDKSLVAYLVWSAGAARASDSAVVQFLRRQLPEYMVPAAFVTLERLPLTPNGKVDRRALPQPEPVVASARLSSPPADELQAQLIGIWQAVLSKKSIGVHDNFFELGGHSLLAARLMHRIGQVLGTTVPLALLFQAPTIAQLSSALRQSGWSQHFSSVVPIQPLGSKPPFFCVHGVGGNVLNLRQLASHMNPDYPLYGLQAQGLDGKSRCLSSIEEMATHYIEEIRMIQGGGPYFLGGYSLGGMVAYEMAQQLSAKGEEVGLVILLDTYPGKVKSTSHSLLRILLSPQQLFVDMPYAAVDSARRRIKRGRVAPELKTVFHTNGAAGDRYVLKPYGGSVHLFRAAEKSWRSSADPYAAWSKLAPRLETHEVPGDHRGLLYEPQVRHLANGLKARIDQAIADYELAKQSLCSA